MTRPMIVIVVFLQVSKQFCKTDFHGHRPGQTDQRLPQRGASLSDIPLAGLIV
jgi:hypothetical protein